MMSTQNYSKNEALAAQKFAESLQKYPTEVQVGVGIVLPELMNGCSWGFVPDTNDEYKRVLEDIGKNRNMSSIKVQGGFLYSIDMSYLLSVLGNVASGLYTKQDLEIASRHRMEALNALEKFLRKGETGKIGIYSLNDSPRITVKGVSYPAFCVTMQDLLSACVKNGYGLKLGNTVRTPGEVLSHAVQVVERLEIAPSKNALFIEVAKLKK